jgi:hypothetical protein
MTRRVINQAAQGLNGEKLDTYFDRVVKYIPSDIVAAWVAAVGIIKSGSDKVGATTVLWIAFLFGVVMCFLWTWKQTQAKDANGQPLKPAWKQISISTAAFIVWVIALGGPPLSIEPMIGSLLLIGFTLIVAFVDP